MFDRSFRLVLILTISLLMGVVAALVVSSRVDLASKENETALPHGARYLAAAYGPDRYSQFAEEWIIRDFFQDKRDGVNVDAGANHYRDSSTTYYLEKTLGRSGLAIEPLSQFEADYKTHRPKTTILAF